MNASEQTVPVKIYRSEHRLTIAAPLPGLEPQDILVTVDEQGMFMIDGQVRGLLKGQNEVLADEWNPGPYHKSLHLPDKVDATMANVTYENGVLVVSLPRSDEIKPASIDLERLSATEGKHFGNAGHPVGAQRMSEGQHQGARDRIGNPAVDSADDRPRTGTTG